jgi:hypothetical protein
MSQILKRIIIVFAVVTTLLFFSLIGAAWYLGAFSGVTVATSDRPVQYFIAASDSGTYQQAMNDLDTLRSHIQKTPSRMVDPVVLLYRDPVVVPLAEVPARAAYLLADSVSVDLPYRMIVVPPARIVSARIEANPVIAPYKTYPAIREWCFRYDLVADTGAIIVEKYLDSGEVSVEYPVFSEQK